ncbi:pyocin activator PrtN family protein [Thalassobius sp. S69A]|uniref:pyocin activator PrtN family protein n=1 Tax=unclassified Thalassovita TaxID=2619711 RepID=UPI003C7AB716
MNTLWMLMGQYEGQPVIPVDVVARDHFGLDRRVFLRKVDDGSIALPVMRMEESQKSAKGVHVHDLAEYIDRRRADARREFEQLHH